MWLITALVAVLAAGALAGLSRYTERWSARGRLTAWVAVVAGTVSGQALAFGPPAGSPHPVVRPAASTPARPSATPGPSRSPAPSFSPSPVTVAVPRLAGLSGASARRRLHAAGLRVGRAVRRLSTRDGGTVLVSRPAAGVRVAPGTAVDLVLAERPVPVPPVWGLSAAQARQVCAAVGLRVVVRSAPAPDGTVVGKVLTQHPAAGSAVAPGSTVTITVGHTLGP